MTILFLLCQYGVWSVDRLEKSNIKRFNISQQHNKTWKKWWGMNTFARHCIPPLYWYSICLCWTLFMNRWRCIKQYIKSVSVAHRNVSVCLTILHLIHFICDKSVQTPWERHREQKVSGLTAPLLIPPRLEAATLASRWQASSSRTNLLTSACRKQRQLK